MERLDKVERLLLQCEKDQERLIEIHKEIKATNQRMQELTSYYETQYLKDYDTLKDSNLCYKVLDQDSIWNVIVANNQEKIAISKTVVGSL